MELDPEDESGHYVPSTDTPQMKMEFNFEEVGIFWRAPGVPLVPPICGIPQKISSVKEESDK